MRIILSILILLFYFQSLTMADDIEDLEIEGISIGDSLLLYSTDQEIKKKNDNGLSFKKIQ